MRLLGVEAGYEDAKGARSALREVRMIRVRVRFAVLACVLLAGALTGCASTGDPGGRTDPFSAAATSDEVLLTVENNDFRDASIYAIWSGVRRRIGSVTGKTSETFRMTWRSEDIQLEIDFLGGGGYVSERVPVTQGDHLNFVILAQ
jgi:hypothetical protein